MIRHKNIFYLARLKKKLSALSIWNHLYPRVSLSMSRSFTNKIQFPIAVLQGCVFPCNLHHRIERVFFSGETFRKQYSPSAGSIASGLKNTLHFIKKCFAIPLMCVWPHLGSATSACRWIREKDGKQSSTKFSKILNNKSCSRLREREFLVGFNGMFHSHSVDTKIR